MYPIKKFSNLPKHQGLVNRATEVLIKDKRCRGIYVSGSQVADEYSDVDFTILCLEEDQKSLLDDRYKIAEKVGKIKCAAIPPVSDEMLVVFYEDEEVKFDFAYSKIPINVRPDRVNIDILYDPEEHLKKIVEESEKLDWDIDLEFLKNRVKHHFLGISYTVSKFGRGELWDGNNCIEWYRGNILMFEDILAKRKREGYRRIEQKLDAKRQQIFEQTLVKEITRKELFRAMDVINLYFETFLKKPLRELGVFDEISEKNMMEFYNRKKREILDLV
jgi:hypothetical protein